MGSVKTIIKYGCPTIFLLSIAILAAGMIPQRTYQQPPTPTPPTYSDPIKIVEFIIDEENADWKAHPHIAVLGHVNGTQIMVSTRFYESVRVGDYVRIRRSYFNMYSRGYDPSYGSAKIYRNGTYIGEFGIYFKDDC